MNARYVLHLRNKFQFTSFCKSMKHSSLSLSVKLVQYFRFWYKSLGAIYQFWRISRNYKMSYYKYW